MVKETPKTGRRQEAPHPDGSGGPDRSLPVFDVFSKKSRRWRDDLIWD